MNERSRYFSRRHDRAMPALWCRLSGDRLALRGKGQRMIRNVTLTFELLIERVLFGKDDEA